MYTISKEFRFEAAHLLRGLPENHPCSNLHGHSYIVIFELSSVILNEVGFVVDYRKLDTIKKYIDEIVDHQYLNQVFLFNPTAENLAKHFFKLFKRDFPQLSAVIVKETEKTMAKYTPFCDEEA
jgi:6-pyruvoyltetrahydropterin/6-carboxytetrahydropterin synthase